MHNQPFPRRPLIAIGIMLLGSITVTAFVRITGVGKAALPQSPEVTVRDLRFEDRSDGSLLVHEANGAQPDVILASGSNNFIRATLRILAKERRRSGYDDTVPFRLAARADGRLTLHDPTTGRTLELESFGATNAGAFARLLDLPVTPRAGQLSMAQPPTR